MVVDKMEKKESPKAKKPEKPLKETKEEKRGAEAKKPADKEEAQAEQKPPEQAGAAKKKINKMTLAEIETKLKEIEGTMGGLKSKYAQQLLHRKKILSP
jgi:hypothetical protein